MLDEQATYTSLVPSQASDLFWQLISYVGLSDQLAIAFYACLMLKHIYSLTGQPAFFLLGLPPLLPTSLPVSYADLITFLSIRT